MIRTAIAVAVVLSAACSICRADPTLVSIDPDRALQGQTLEVTIIGDETHFRYEMGSDFLHVDLVKDDADDIGSARITVDNNTEMRAVFDIPNASEPGMYDLEVNSSNDGRIRLEECFQIFSSTRRLVPDFYETVREAVAEADDGDTVLIAPGRYLEGFVVNGKSLIIASETILTGDPAYIDSTVIDGYHSVRPASFSGEATQNSVLYGLTIRNGIDGFGGGIFCDEQASITVEQCRIEHNSARGYGGGITCWNNSNATFRRCVIAENSAPFGAAIACRTNSNPRFINCTITNNVARDENGGVYCLSESAPLLLNSILWNNTAPEILFDDTGQPNSITAAYTDVSGGAGGVRTNDNGEVDWLDGNIDADPFFLDPDNAGYHLRLEDSPCIDAAIAVFEYEGEFIVALTEDEYNGPAPDMGVYEADARFVRGGSDAVPETINLLPVYPNPFNARASARFELEIERNLSLTALDPSGRLVVELFNGIKTAGSHEFTLDASRLESGLHFVRLTSGGETAITRTVLIK